MFLAIYVYRQLGLTIDVTEEHLRVPQSALREGPAYDRLTADPDSLRDPEGLRNWLAAFLPENGAATPFEVHARNEWARHGTGTNRITAASILWGNTDAEYAGAVDFRQADADPPGQLPDPPIPVIEPLSDQEIGDRLAIATRIAEAAPQTRPSELLDLPGRRTSLSGMRGKLGLSPLPDVGWGIASGGSLNTWICKHEQRPDLPGEAGVEAICQRALGLVRIPAAETVARVFDGKQAVLSRRSDRTVTPDGCVEARHQEEWVQAACHPPKDKYFEGRPGEPGWPHAYDLFSRRARHPAEEQGRLTRTLIAAWLCASGDLHRRNIGFLHAPPTDPAGIEIAPVYDFSSAADTPYSPHPAIPIHQARYIHKITLLQWILHSEQCGVEPDVTLAAAAELIRILPDAIATARERARTEDENLHPAAVAKRSEAVVDHVRARGRDWGNQVNRLAKRRLPVLLPETRAAAEALGKAADSQPGGRVSCTPGSDAGTLDLAYQPPGGAPPVPIAAGLTPRHAAAAAAYAGLAKPEEIPELERSLEAGEQDRFGGGRTPG